MLDKRPVGFIGAGNMASAMIRGLCSSVKNIKISASDPAKNALKNLPAECRVKKTGSNLKLVLSSEVIILAVKPRDAAGALSGAGGAITKKHLLISIAAGITIKKIQALAGMKLPVVRVMPNTPALVGEGACAYAASPQVSPEDIKYTEKFLSSFCGTVIRMNEKKMNAVTAAGGSGPAYFFYAAEGIISGAVKAGLNRKDARELVARTMLGAGKLLLETGEEPALLRKKVTSKGGTTQAALSVLEKNKTAKVFEKAVIAAKKRADEMEA